MHQPTRSTPEGHPDPTGYQARMTTPTPRDHDPDHDQDHDQDADPPTADGREPDTTQLDPDSEPGSDPDPLPRDAPGSLGGDNGGG